MDPPNSWGAGCGESEWRPFQYLSARAPAPLVRVGVFSPSALRSTPLDQVDLTAEIRHNQATVLSRDDGPGSRVYDLQRGTALIILLTGGDKGSQAKDIDEALLLAVNLTEEI